MSDNIDELLNQLEENKTTLLIKPSAEQPQTNLTDTNINPYILQKIQTLIDTGIDSVQSLKEIVLSGGDDKDISAYSEVFKAVVGALDTLTKIELQNKKAKTAKELKEMDVKARKELPDSPRGNTNILIATREEVFKNFIKQGEKIIENSIDPVSDKPDKPDKQDKQDEDA